MSLKATQGTTALALRDSNLVCLRIKQVYLDLEIFMMQRYRVPVNACDAAWVKK